MQKSPTIIAAIVIFLLFLVGGSIVVVVLKSSSQVGLKNIHITITEPSNEEYFVLLAHSSNRFGLEIFKTFSKRRNLLFSPISLSSSLGLMYLGARGWTENEMKFALGLNTFTSQNGSWFHKAFEEYRLDLANLSRPDQFRYLHHIANTLWIPDGQKVSNDFANEMTRYYDANVFVQEKGQDRNRTIRTISKWILYQIGVFADNAFVFRIPLPADAKTAMIYASVAYMKATWATIFQSNYTVYRTFLQRGEKEDYVPMMHATMDSVAYGYSEELSSKLLELPYSEDCFSMVFILPVIKKGYEELEDKLTDVKLLNAIQHLEKTPSVDVRIPRFVLEGSHNLRSSLEDRGIRSAFNSRNSNFSRISSDGGHLWVSDVLHQVVLRVNEQGTDGLVQSDPTEQFVSVSETGLKKQFHADHPFIFVVRDRRSEMILFMGRVYEIYERTHP